jgi:hypothetical protein
VSACCDSATTCTAMAAAAAASQGNKHEMRSEKYSTGS